MYMRILNRQRSIRIGPVLIYIYTPVEIQKFYRLRVAYSFYIMKSSFDSEQDSDSFLFLPKRVMYETGTGS